MWDQPAAQTCGRGDSQALSFSSRDPRRAILRRMARVRQETGGLPSREAFPSSHVPWRRREWYLAVVPFVNTQFLEARPREQQSAPSEALKPDLIQAPRQPATPSDRAPSQRCEDRQHERSEQQAGEQEVLRGDGKAQHRCTPRRHVDLRRRARGLGRQCMPAVKARQEEHHGPRRPRSLPPTALSGCVHHHDIALNAPPLVGRPDQVVRIPIRSGAARSAPTGTPRSLYNGSARSVLRDNHWR